MEKRKRQTWVASVSLVGAVVGVGIFGVPFVISRVGLLPALVYFVVLCGIQILQNLFFAEAAIACKEDHGLPGLAKLYLGRTAGKIGGAALVLGYWVSLTAYVVVGGTFVSVILQPWFGGSPFIYALAWGIVGGFAVRFGLRTILRLEFIGTMALVAALLFILGTALPHVQAGNMPLLRWIDPIIPYGVILFSLAGMTAVPEMERIVDGRREDYRRAIVRGTLIAAVLTLAFGLIVWGVSGDSVTEDAVSGLRSVLGSAVALPAALIGFLAVATSYFATAANVKDTFLHDFRYHLNVSWLLAVTPPIIVFLFGGRDFINLIGFSGAVFGGIMSLLVGLMYLRVRRRRLVRRKPLRVPPLVTYLAMTVFGLGVIVELYDYFKHLL